MGRTGRRRDGRCGVVIAVAGVFVLAVVEAHVEIGVLGSATAAPCADRAWQSA